jgi:serine/threonine-protein kinase RsbW
MTASRPVSDETPPPLSGDPGQTSADQPGPPESASAELRVPADIAYLPVLRTVTASLAARCDLTIDQVEDLRIAVDEASALLLPHASRTSQLEARFAVADGRLTVTVSVPAGSGAEPDRDGFAWTVLTALADEVQVRQGESFVAIELSKSRGAATP